MRNTEQEEKKGKYNMKDLEELIQVLATRITEIRNKKNVSAKDIKEFNSLMEDLECINNAKNILRDYLVKNI